MQFKTTIILIILLSPLTFLAQENKINILVPGYATAWSDSEKNNIREYFIDRNCSFSWTDIEQTDWQTANIDQYDIIWLHEGDSLKSKQKKDKTFYRALINYVEKGGNILLTQHALDFLNQSGLEPVEVSHKPKESSDNGYGRMLGFHAFLDHPLFDSLNGGSYIWKPPHDTIVTQCGFFGEDVPENGKVIGVDWDYIFVREDAKLIVEYEIGKGKILGIGAYFNLYEPNLNRDHFNVFYDNVLTYLHGAKKNKKEHYWIYGKQDVKPIGFVLERQLIPEGSKKWETTDSKMTLSRKQALHEYCEVAGRRILVAAFEPGGIYEVWAHPFMAFRDYSASITLDGETYVNLSELKPEIKITPASITRIYTPENSVRLTETICVSPHQPAGVIHYEYEGPPAELQITYKSNMRIMWPYSGNAIKTIEYAYQPGFNAVEIAAPEAGLTALIGASQIPLSSKFSEHDSDSGDSLFYLGVSQSYDLMGNAEIDIVFAAGNEGRNDIINEYMQVLSSPEDTYMEAVSYYQAFNKDLLNITTPDPDFNLGYQWALAATDRFFVNTPGLGTSLVAGYNGTDRGWDGGHKVNGRPGYAWYFGRDAVWSAFAVLDYGDHLGVKKVLDMLIKYQDLSGKIFHELSTSGFVHYDASDATPLFIILAERYLEHSGDTAYILDNWPAIKKAIDFCRSTDTDQDGLIENTNVGHGWVEGGHLFGSHTSLYLASCWTEAMESATLMIQYTGAEEKNAVYAKESMRLRELINTKFYNPENGFFYQGIYKDGSFHTEESILPSIPIYFRQINPSKSAKMLDAFASADYTSDWGVRITGKSSKHYHPRGYHSGSVWPLFTGWVALAEYAENRSAQGFSHIMSNLNIFRDFSLGYLEEVLNGEKYLPSGVCPHQCWSETMVLQPIIEGMLGLKPNAPAKRLEFNPYIPPQWNSIMVENIKVGDKMIDWEMTREPGMTAYHFSGDAKDINIYFEPVLPEGTEVDSILVNNEAVEIISCAACQGVTLKLDLDLGLTGDTEVKIYHEKGIELIPPVAKPAPGESSEGIRIIRTSWEDKTYTIHTQGAAGKRYTLEVMNGFGPPLKVEGAEYKEESAKLILQIDFPASSQDYMDKSIKIKF